jgi:hypothetical protein
VPGFVLAGAETALGRVPSSGGSAIDYRLLTIDFPIIDRSERSRAPERVPGFVLAGAEMAHGRVPFSAVQLSTIDC